MSALLQACIRRIQCLFWTSSVFKRTIPSFTISIVLDICEKIREISKISGNFPSPFGVFHAVLSSYFIKMLMYYNDLPRNTFHFIHIEIFYQFFSLLLEFHMSGFMSNLSLEWWWCTKQMTTIQNVYVKLTNIKISLYI